MFWSCNRCVTTVEVTAQGAAASVEAATRLGMDVGAAACSGLLPGPSGVVLLFGAPSVCSMWKRIAETTDDKVLLTLDWYGWVHLSQALIALDNPSVTELAVLTVMEMRGAMTSVSNLVSYLGNLPYRAETETSQAVREKLELAASMLHTVDRQFVLDSARRVQWRACLLRHMSAAVKSLPLDRLVHAARAMLSVADCIAENTADFNGIFCAYVWRLCRELQARGASEDEAFALFRLRVQVWCQGPMWPGDIATRPVDSAVLTDIWDGLGRLLRMQAQFVHEVTSSEKTTMRCFRHVVQATSESTDLHGKCFAALRFMEGVAAAFRTHAAVVWHLLPFNIADMDAADAMDQAAEVMLPGIGDARRTSVLVSLLLDPASLDAVLTPEVCLVVKATFERIQAHLEDVWRVLVHFLAETGHGSQLFCRYLQSRLGREEHQEPLRLSDGSLRHAIAGAVEDMRTLAFGDAIPKGQLILAAAVWARGNLAGDVVGAATYFADLEPAGFQPPGPLTLEARLDVLPRVIRQLEVLDLLNGLAAGLDQHGLGHLMATGTSDAMPGELHHLREYLDLEGDTVVLSNVRPDGQSIAVFQALSPGHMALLKTCGRYADVKRWVVDMKFVDPAGDGTEGMERFHRMVDYVTSLVQGEEYSEGVLKALMDTMPMIALFVAPPSLTALVEGVGRFTTAAMAQLDVVERCLGQIQDWFDDNVSSTVGGVHAQLLAIWEGGRVVVAPPRVTIHFSQRHQAHLRRHVWTPEQLAEFRSTVAFMTGVVEDAAVVQAFLRAGEVVGALPALAAALSDVLPDGGQVLEMAYQDCGQGTQVLDRLAVELSNGRAQLGDVRRAHPVLCCMSLRQSLRLLQACRACLQATAPSPQARADLVTHLALCGLVVKDTSASGVAKALAPDEQVEQVDERDDGTWAALRGLGRLVHRLVDAGAVWSCVVPAAECVMELSRPGDNLRSVAVDVPDATAAQVYACIAGVFQGRSPAASQLLWCTADTTADDLDAFFKRCCANQEAVYVLISPHAVPHHVSDTMDGWMMSDALRGGRMVVVFTKDCSYRRLCTSVLPTSYLGRRTFADGSPSGVSVRRVMGRSGDGKTHAISKYLAGLDRGWFVLRTQVSESFSRDAFVEDCMARGDFLDAALEGRAMVLVFHVSAYAPFRELDRFLFDLLATGVVPSRRGAVLALVPPRQVHVLVEVPEPLPVHEDRGTEHHARPAVFEGTVGALGGRQPQAPFRCTCQSCLQEEGRRTGVPFSPDRGCANLLPSLDCFAVEDVTVSHAAPMDVVPRFQQALRMLRAYVLPLPGLKRARAHRKMVHVQPCGPACPPRFLIDALALDTDRLPEYVTQEVCASSGHGGWRDPQREYKVVFSDPALDPRDVTVSGGKKDVAVAWSPPSCVCVCVCASRRRCCSKWPPTTLTPTPWRPSWRPSVPSRTFCRTWPVRWRCGTPCPA